MLFFAPLIFSVSIPLFLTNLVLASSEWIEYPDSGYATMTHYTMAPGYVAACGCTAASANYPTAAMSQMAYGSSANYGAPLVIISRWVMLNAMTLGPACGRCFKLTLLNPVIATPPFHPNVVKSVVVKVTDLCPLSSTGWCSATTNKTNSYATLCCSIFELTSKRIVLGFISISTLYILLRLFQTSSSRLMLPYMVIK